MQPHCSLCGRFMGRLWDQPTTGSPPGASFSGTVPYAPYACSNRECGVSDVALHVEYHPGGWRL